MLTKVQVGILIFDGVEVLDFAGPYEVFSRTRLVPGIDSRRTDESAPFRVFTVASRTGPITATGGLRVLPDHAFGSAPAIDVLVVPGGFGTRQLLNEPDVLAWIRDTASSASRVASVCTGALVLARAGLLAGRRATTHWGALDLLADLDPTIEVEKNLRVVQDGIITSAGVAAGIDMALDLVEATCGSEVADETARYIEYPRLSRPQPNAAPVPDADLAARSRDQLIEEVKRLRQGIRVHRDSTGHELCWHHPALWSLLPEEVDPLPTVPAWPQFLRGCIRYRQSLDEQLPDAPRTHEEHR